MTRVLSAFMIVLAAAALPAVAADAYEIDGSHSVAIFKITHLGIGNYYGRFNDISGTLTLDEGNPSANSVDITIKTASVDTYNEKRDKHINSPDFLNSKQFPVATFKSDSVKATKSGFEVSGTLQLHGVKKPLTIQVDTVGMGNDPWGKYRAGFETRFTFKRSDFGMTYMLDGLSDEIELLVAIEAIKK